jgi:hypothetical protein
MTVPFAQLVVRLSSAYAPCGAVFVLIVLPRLVLRLDPGLRAASVAVRLLIAPGLGALWPLFAWRLLAASAPPIERTAHRDLASARHAVSNRQNGPAS